MKEKYFKFLKKPTFWLILTIVIGFWDSPVADWHSWRQADTAAVSRSFYKEGFNILYPKYDDMSGVAEKPIPNPNRYRYVEFPIYNTLVYFAYLLNGGVDERLARLVSIFFSLGSTYLIYLIVKRYWGEFSAILSSLLFAILPFNIFFSRVILPEPSLVFFSLGMFYFVDKWIFEGGSKLYIVSLLFTACAFLTKPYAAFYLLPLVYSFYKKEGKWWPVPMRYFGLLVPALVPFFAWRSWILQHPEGIPASNWLFNGNHIRFKPMFWTWILGDRFGREILSMTGSFLFFIGLLKKPFEKEGYLLHILGFSMFLYMLVLATGNVQHDYYQTFIVPALVMFTARGFVVLMKGIPGFLPRLITVPIALLFLPITVYATWAQPNGIKTLYQINNGAIVDAGRVADRILPKDAIVVAPYGGDTSFLYQTNRTGWAVVGDPMKDLHDMFGVDYYISTAKDAKTKWVMRKYTTLVDTKDFVIVDITKEKAGFDRINDIEPAQ